ncbi:MAG: hypothetical protein WCB46_00970, partial [Methanoregula sp.]
GMWGDSLAGIKNMPGLWPWKKIWTFFWKIIQKNIRPAHSPVERDAHCHDPAHLPHRGKYPGCRTGFPSLNRFPKYASHCHTGRVAGHMVAWKQRFKKPGNLRLAHKPF